MMILMPTLALSSAWIKARPNNKIHLTRRNVNCLQLRILRAGDLERSTTENHAVKDRSFCMSMN